MWACVSWEGNFCKAYCVREEEQQQQSWLTIGANKRKAEVCGGCFGGCAYFIDMCLWVEKAGHFKRIFWGEPIG